MTISNETNTQELYTEMTADLEAAGINPECLNNVILVSLKRTNQGTRKVRSSDYR